MQSRCIVYEFISKPYYGNKHCLLTWQWQSENKTMAKASADQCNRFARTVRGELFRRFIREFIESISKTDWWFAEDLSVKRLYPRPDVKCELQVAVQPIEVSDFASTIPDDRSLWIHLEESCKTCKCEGAHYFLVQLSNPIICKPLLMDQRDRSTRRSASSSERRLEELRSKEDPIMMSAQ